MSEASELSEEHWGEELKREPHSPPVFSRYINNNNCLLNGQCVISYSPSCPISDAAQLAQSTRCPALHTTQMTRMTVAQTLAVTKNAVERLTLR
jgi:hypothetical protein